jgi:molybdate transport system ATP-binding protein
VVLDGPLPVVAEVTPAAVEGLGLRIGSEVWAAVKATEVACHPA